ncbi:MAG: hypothetical protein EAY69_05495 [Cytophagales bacterium]|nr:MAG: hypothetical protein EAY69_05495 [Cytophagales bacterium]
MKRKIILLSIICIFLTIIFFFDFPNKKYKQNIDYLYDDLKKYVKITKSIKLDSLKKYLKPLDFKKNKIFDDKFNVTMEELDSYYFTFIEKIVNDYPVRTSIKKLKNIFFWTINTVNKEENIILNSHILLISVKSNKIVDVLVFENNEPDTIGIIDLTSEKWSLRKKGHWVNFFKEHLDENHYYFYVTFHNKIVLEKGGGNPYNIKYKDVLRCNHYKYPYKKQKWKIDEHGYFILLEDLNLCYPEVDYIIIK